MSAANRSGRRGKAKGVGVSVERKKDEGLTGATQVEAVMRAAEDKFVEVFKESRGKVDPDLKLGY